MNGKRVLGRKTKWGIIEGEQSPSHPQPFTDAGSSTYSVSLPGWVPSCAMWHGAVVPRACQSALPGHPNTTEPSCQSCPSALLCSGEPSTL